MDNLMDCFIVIFNDKDKFVLVFNHHLWQGRFKKKLCT